MLQKKALSSEKFPMKKSLNGRIMKNTIGALLLLVLICSGIMVASMQSLTSSILLDNLQPLARQSAKTVESNIHMLADRMMTIAGDTRLLPQQENQANQHLVLDTAQEVYEFSNLALYNLDGSRFLGNSSAPTQIEGAFFDLLRETDNLTTGQSTLSSGSLGISMGMPVKENGSTVFYLVGTYKYDALSDVLSNINVGKSGYAMIVNSQGQIVGHPSQDLVLSGTMLLDLDRGYESVYNGVVATDTAVGEAVIDGENTLLGYAPVQGTQWSLLVQVPKSDYALLVNRAIFMIAIVALCLLALSLVMMYRLSHSISTSVKKVARRMVGLSDGDLQTEADQLHSRDELELLTATMSSTVSSMKLYISEIQRVLSHIAAGELNIAPQGEYRGDFSQIRDALEHIILSLNETMCDFKAAAVRVAYVAENLSGQSGQLHHASMEQTEAAAHLVNEVSTVKDRLADVTHSTDQTRERTEEIARKIQNTNDQMQSLTGAMNDIQNNAGEITKIAKAIQDIAFQTNILALNASVEAARAGAAGKGFSVVANEVKQLAAKSGEAAQAAARMVENTREIIHTGVALTAETAQSLEEISKVSGQIGQITHQLSSDVQEQQSALIHMEEKIETISAIADRNLQSAGDTAQSSTLLAQEADELQSQIRRFILRERGE